MTAQPSQHRVWVYGDDVNTDVIFPGKYTYTLKTPEDIAARALEDLDPAFAQAARPGDVIVAGRNWGCGSSREQAVTALKYLGIRVIVAASFNGLYQRNCINQGMYPVVCADLHMLVRSGDRIAIDLHAGRIHAADRVFDFAPLKGSAKAIFEAGGLVPMLRARFYGEG